MVSSQNADVEAALHGLAAYLRPKARIADKYEVERVLGEGGMGVVVAAMHVEVGRRFAIKLLRVSLASDPAAAYARFAREARIGAELRNRHTAAVHDCGFLGDQAQPHGTPYIVMDYLEGETLRDLLNAQRTTNVRMPIMDAIDYILQACDALEEAHALGIVHRDLTPSNLFVTQRDRGIGLLKVLDFGVAKLTEDPSGGALTRSRSFIGSPLYMAPEQMASAREVDRRADIWSLAAILHELVAGVPAFRGATLPEACLAVVLHPPPSLCTLRSDAPYALQELVLRCLSKDREARPRTVGALREELVAIRSNLDLGSCDTIRAAVFPSIPASARENAPATLAPSAKATTAKTTTAALLGKRGATEALVIATLLGAGLVVYSGHETGVALQHAQRAVGMRAAAARQEVPQVDVLRVGREGPVTARGISARADATKSIDAARVTAASAASSASAGSPAASASSRLPASDPRPPAREGWRWGDRE